MVASPLSDTGVELRHLSQRVIPNRRASVSPLPEGGRVRTDHGEDTTVASLVSDIRGQITPPPPQVCLSFPAGKGQVAAAVASLLSNIWVQLHHTPLQGHAQQACLSFPITKG